MAAVKESAAAAVQKQLRCQQAQRQPNEPCDQGNVTSKLDLAERRRRERRTRVNGRATAEERPLLLLSNGNLAASSTGSSDSEQDWESDGEYGGWRQQCLLLTKGPPCKLHVTPQKLHFLHMFGLTTLAKKNDLELAKCERRLSRHWEELVPLELEEQSEEVASPLPPELPHPCGSPGALNKSCDYQAKIYFLRYLNLEPITAAKRTEREALWQQVVRERVRRNSINGVVLYTSRQNEMRTEKPAPNDEHKVPMAKGKAPCVSAPAAVCPGSQLTVPRPNSPLNNGAAPASASKLACLLPVAQRRASSSEDESQLPPKVAKWTGIEEIMHAYNSYSQECELEAGILRKQCQRLHHSLMEGRQKAELMDTQLRELVARKNMLDFEHYQLQTSLEQLNASVRKVR